LNTGIWHNIRTILGGTQAGRFSNLWVPYGDGTGDATSTRTVLRGLLESVFEDLLSSVPGFRMINGHSAGDRTGTHNHPNGVAIDINTSRNWSLQPADSERNRSNFSDNEPYLTPHAVERILNQHGWQVGYIVGTIMTRMFHWSFSRT